MKLNIFMAALLCLGACTTPIATTQMNESVDAQKRIKVTADSEKAHSVLKGLDKRLYITHVDDESTNTMCFHWPDCYAEEVFVAPGKHYLKLKFTYTNSFAYSKVWFDAQEGQSYIVRKRFSGYGVQFWVEDAATGRPVGGLPEAEIDEKK